MRPLLAASLLLALAGCGGHGARTTASRPPPPPAKIRVALTADTHHPRVGKRWHYEVRVTDASGKPVPASIHLQILFGGAPVGQIGRHRVENGVWSETIGAPGNPPFPASARGVRLVFEAVVKALGETKRADYWIKVR